jgi:hypothetical protein
VVSGNARGRPRAPVGVFRPRAPVGELIAAPMRDAGAVAPVPAPVEPSPAATTPPPSEAVPGMAMPPPAAATERAKEPLEENPY